MEEHSEEIDILEVSRKKHRDEIMKKIEELNKEHKECLEINIQELDINIKTQEIKYKMKKRKLIYKYRLKIEKCEKVSMKKITKNNKCYVMLGMGYLYTATKNIYSVPFCH